MFGTAVRQLYRPAVTLCVGQGAKMSYENFKTYSAKAIAGINKLPDTIASRSIPIRLKRARRGKVQKFQERLPEVTAPLEELRGRIESFVDQIAEKVKGARPSMPEELSDRQADVTEPLVVIADILGGEWPESARRALVTLCTSAAVPLSRGEQLLGDIRKVFDGKAGIDRIASAALAKEICEIEGASWAEYGKGEKPISATKIASLLKRYDIHPHPVRDGDDVFRGYEREDFADTWGRYLPPTPVIGPQTVTPLQTNEEAVNNGTSCNGVTLQGPITESGRTAACGSPNCAGCYDLGDGRKVHPPKHGAVQ
jgi:hypothetical protein